MQIDHNPLLSPVLEVLQEQTEAITEHQLINALRAELEGVPELGTDSQLALFRTHFLVMNALYRLQHDLLQGGVYLAISPLAIAMEPAGEGASVSLREASERPLAEYYLNLANLRDTGEDEVERLLQGFWERFLARDRRGDALAVMDLPVDADWPCIQQRYRRLAAQHHPDRGGDPREFIRLREAFECLRRAGGVQSHTTSE